MESWPFTECDPTLAEAITFIASVTVRERESVDSSRRRVRDHIRKASGRKRKTPYDAPRDSAARVGSTFWDWAAHEWPALNALPDFPYKLINRAVCVGIVGPVTCSGLLVQIPPDAAELERRFVEESRRAHALDVELGATKLALDSANAQVSEQRRRDEVTRQKRSDAGKRGKGVPRRMH